VDLNLMLELQAVPVRHAQIEDQTLGQRRSVRAQVLSAEVNVSAGTEQGADCLSDRFVRTCP
jgi:hypothetical protein